MLQECTDCLIVVLTACNVYRKLYLYLYKVRSKPTYAYTRYVIIVVTNCALVMIVDVSVCSYLVCNNLFRRGLRNVCVYI